MADAFQAARVAAVRRFNRFYTRHVGALNEGLLRSEFSLTEMRVLYELAHRDGCTASGLGRDLGLDAGYLSRILKSFEARGLIERLRSDTDARQQRLALTHVGAKAFAPFDQASSDEVVAVLTKLSRADQERLVRAMAAVERLLGSDAETAARYVLRGPRSGDYGTIIGRQGALYAEEYGWDETFEALVAEIVASFIKSFDPKRERCWVAERDGEVVGSVFVVQQSSSVAKLRLLYVDASARGLGIGARLVAECVGFARKVGYSTLTLWTNDVLVSARRLYEAAGFVLTEEENHRSFGKDLIGQTLELKL
jgi:DNA-binding MarR family transcriptional regulator/N-acetylglutamate synthase-like GNAT family acetyltransferase